MPERCTVSVDVKHRSRVAYSTTGLCLVMQAPLAATNSHTTYVTPAKAGAYSSFDQCYRNSGVVWIPDFAGRKKTPRISAWGFSQGSLRSPHTSLTITDERARAIKISQEGSPARHPGEGRGVISRNAWNDKPGTGPSHSCPRRLQ